MVQLMARIIAHGKIKMRLTSLLLVLLILCAPSVVADDCSADVQQGDADISLSGDVLVKLTVVPHCSKGCEGKFECRVHYLNKNGDHREYRSTELWVSHAGDSVEIVSKGYEQNCDSVHLGPCKLRAVEILNKHCQTAITR
jgi:hypothetical protein